RLRVGALRFNGSVQIGIELLDRSCQTLCLVDHEIVQRHERKVRVTGSVRHGSELFGVAEIFGSEIHVRAFVEKWLQPFMESGRYHGNRSWRRSDRHTRWVFFS